MSKVNLQPAAINHKDFLKQAVAAVFDCESFYWYSVFFFFWNSYILKFLNVVRVHVLMVVFVGSLYEEFYLKLCKCVINTH